LNIAISSQVHKDNVIQSEIDLRRSFLGDLNHSRLQVIVAQGDVADSFFIMADGAAAAYVEWEEGDKTLRRRELCRYGQGDFFGERGLLGGTGRLATVVSVGGCAALRMDRAAFLRLVGWMHGVADKQYPVHVPGLWPQPR
jgi:CRP-like cAMP-binding protein